MADFESSEASKQLQAKIQAAHDAAKEQHRREAFRRRMEVAKKGIRVLKEGKPLEAAYHFRSYLRIVEDAKGIDEHALNPTLFDKDKEVQELLLIAGVYWDLAKIYDRSSNPESEKDMRIFLNKFVVFSKGMPYAPVSSETLRKTLSFGRVRHKKEFREAYMQLSPNKCFVATALVDLIPEPEIQALRRRRDRWREQPIGRIFVELYNVFGPWAAWCVHHASPRVRRACAAGIRSLVQNRSDS